MKLAELRNILKDYDQPTLCEIAVALYKAIPKQNKEDKDIDELLKDFNSKKQEIKKQGVPVDFDSLKRNVLRFLEYAGEQFYFAPNRYVPKKDRPKWRFITKQYIKDLMTVTGENSEEASNLLTLLYRMLSHACNYYIFRTENPFSSVGYKQADLLRIVLAKMLYNGITKESLQEAIALTIESNVDMETLHISLFFVLIDQLKTNEAKEMAAEECVNYKEKLKGASFFRDGYFQANKDRFYQEKRVERSVELYFYIKAVLDEFDTAIAYYWENNKNRDARESEIALYVLLNWLEMFEQPGLWIDEYEKALKRNVKPREDIRNIYGPLKKGQSFEAIHEAILRKYNS
jgi:hypothetical protein